MPGYKNLIAEKPRETAIHSYLVEGDQASVTLRIPDTLHGMSFSAFVRICMIEEFSKKGQ